jgi:glycosyltransferase involved in cell wall biosynthesis
MDNETTSPPITIITVTYNSSSYVRDAIESVLAQSYSNIEYIIGDDFSTDNTWSIIQEYKDSRIKAYRNVSNLGEYPNRNKALSMASGKYVLFIDGDDMIYPNAIAFIEKMVTSFPNAGMVIMRPPHPKLFYPLELSSREVLQAEYFDLSLIDIGLTNTVFRVESLKQVGAFPLNWISSDTFVRFKIALNNSTLIINDNLTWWRHTPGQATLSHGKSVKGLAQSYRYRRIIIDEVSQFSEEEKSAAIKNLQRGVWVVAMILVGRGNFVKAFRFVKETRGFSFFLILLSRRKKVDPFANYSSARPYKLAWNKNPYSRI